MLLSSSQRAKKMHLNDVAFYNKKKNVGKFG